MATESVSIPAEAIPEVRRMLTIGLSALSELERFSRDIEFLSEETRERFRHVLPKHPSGCEEITNFASALLWLEHAEPIEEPERAAAAEVAP